MTKLYKNDKIKILKEHESGGVKLLSATKSETKTFWKYNNVKLNDFQQGDLGNCGLIGALACMSQRPEFLTEIAPVIHRQNNGIQVCFKMFSRGKPVRVSIDDTLPFYSETFCYYLFSKFGQHVLEFVLKKLFNVNLFLAYGNSGSLTNFYLASFFEKVFVKQTCCNAYKHSIGTDEYLVFTSFSDCMVSKNLWTKENSKQNLMNHVVYELDNKSSVCLGVVPSMCNEPEKETDFGHCYVVIDYDHDYKALKLYDPNCNPKSCVSDERLPRSIVNNAAPNKGELWVTMDQLKKRYVDVTSLHSKNLYKSFFRLNRKIKLKAKKFKIRKAACKVVLEETSSFMINFFSYVNYTNLRLTVTIAGSNRQKIKPNFELPDQMYGRLNENRRNGESKSNYCQRFVLQPNVYKFSFEFNSSYKSLLTKKEDWLLKIACTSECIFEKLKKTTNFTELRRNMFKQ